MKREAVNLNRTRQIHPQDETKHKMASRNQNTLQTVQRQFTPNKAVSVPNRCQANRSRFEQMKPNLRIGLLGRSCEGEKKLNLNRYEKNYEMYVVRQTPSISELPSCSLSSRRTLAIAGYCNNNTHASTPDVRFILKTADHGEYSSFYDLKVLYSGTSRYASDQLLFAN